MQRDTLVVFAALAIYLAGAFLTAAHYDQHVSEPCYAVVQKARLDDPTKIILFSDCGVPPLVGMAWPAYWAWRGALHVTR
jgi:hypothetical protein